LETSNKKSGPSFRLFSIEKTKGDMKDAYERSERERERERDVGIKLAMSLKTEKTRSRWKYPEVTEFSDIYSR